MTDVGFYIDDFHQRTLLVILSALVVEEKHFFRREPRRTYPLFVSKNFCI